MLIGEFIHTIDEKNRVSLPAKFRKELGKSVILAIGLDKCIAMFTKNEWERVSQRLRESSMLQSDNRSFSRLLFGNAVEASVDSIGRILVPQFLVERSSIKGKVAIIGVDNRVELWNVDSWNKYKNSIEKEADTLAEKLGQVGIL
ncbi:division/cell wall cluster transcriptional repressor MraZ [Candidatus Nomurabacteria bacterium]|nr:division/cell wall cluster transcriptional repressor MraZ [Candidatus Nomurabacteria bacterium]USN95027.1 MAG: division/cell wall cluster transcriptional repressor MraZ [Candidatus Nomurabacteria bacterium]